MPIDPDKEDAIVPVSPDPPKPSKDYQTIKKKLEDLVKKAEIAFRNVSETQILKAEEGYSGITKALAALQVRFMLYIATIKKEIQNKPNLSEYERKVLFEMSNSVQRRITVDNFWTIAKDVAYKQFKPPPSSTEGNQAIETVSERALGIQTDDQENQGIIRNLALGLFRNQDLTTLGTGAVLTGLGGVPPEQAAAISTAISPLIEPLLRSSASALADWLSSEGRPQNQQKLLLGRHMMLEAIEKALRNIPDEYRTDQTNESYQAQRGIIKDIRNMIAEILGARAALFPGELSEDQLEYYLRLFPIELSTFNQSNLLEYRDYFMKSDAPLNEEQTARLNQDVLQVLGVAKAYRIVKKAIGKSSPFPELTNQSNLSLLETSGRRESDKFMVYQDEIPLDNRESPMMFNQYGNNIQVDDSEQSKEPPDAQVPEEEQKRSLEIPPIPHPRCSDYSEHTKLCSSVGDGIRTMCVRPDDNCAESRERWNLRGLRLRTKQPRPRSGDRGSIEGQPEVVDLGGGYSLFDPALFPFFRP